MARTITIKQEDFDDLGAKLAALKLQFEDEPSTYPVEFRLNQKLNELADEWDRKHPDAPVSVVLDAVDGDYKLRITIDNDNVVVCH